MIMLERQRKLGKKDKEVLSSEYDKFCYLQANLTEKFLRVFRRIGYHHSSVMISSYPYEFSSNLELKLLDMDDLCNNKLLEETFNLDSVSKVRNLK